MIHHQNHACRTSQVDELTFRSVAPRLIEAGVGSVVAMSYAVHVEAAKILIWGLSIFYVIQRSAGIVDTRVPCATTMGW